MLKLSESFRMGYGGIEHNLRICKGHGIRQNGIIERRFLNENLIYDDSIKEKNYVKALIRKTIEKEIGSKLAEINEKHIQQGHPGRVCTIDDWIKKQEYTRSGKQKRIVSEYIIQIGNKFTGCPYEIEKDENGNLIDVNGKIIPEWDTRRVPAYKDGKITESEISKKLRKVYKEFVEKFAEENPNARILCASIHNDERAGSHLHINVLWISETKNGVGIGLGKTTAMRQQYGRRKDKENRIDNAQNQWRIDMKLLLKKIAFSHGIEKLHMENKENYRNIAEFKKYKDGLCEQLEDKFLESEMNKNLIRQEWYFLKTNYPEMYQKIHKEYEKNKKIVKKVLDKRTDICYNYSKES